MAESSAKSETKKATPKAAPVKSAPSVDLSKAKELGFRSPEAYQRYLDKFGS
tara:strand:+ start:427 stop:582 length:156 start_codon:yes stop_codon:yes gene_type:complete